MAPLKTGKAPSGRSPTKCGDEVNQRDGGIVARQCGPRWCVVGAKPRQVLAIVATSSGEMAVWWCGTSVKRLHGKTHKVASLGILTHEGGRGGALPADQDESAAILKSPTASHARERGRGEGGEGGQASEHDVEGGGLQ